MLAPSSSKFCLEERFSEPVKHSYQVGGGGGGGTAPHQNARNEVRMQQDVVMMTSCVGRVLPQMSLTVLRAGKGLMII